MNEDLTNPTAMEPVGIILPTVEDKVTSVPQGDQGGSLPDNPKLWEQRLTIEALQNPEFTIQPPERRGLIEWAYRNMTNPLCKSRVQCNAAKILLLANGQNLTARAIEQRREATQQVVTALNPPPVRASTEALRELGNGINLATE